MATAPAPDDYFAQAQQGGAGQQQPDPQFTVLKLEMTDCADIHGRVTIYTTQVDGEPY
jgi:hypothetical protein